MSEIEKYKTNGKKNNNNNIVCPYKMKKEEAIRLIRKNLKFLQNRNNLGIKTYNNKKTKKRKRKNKSGSVSSLSLSSHVSSDSPSLYGGRKGSMRRKRNGGKTMKQKQKHKQKKLLSRGGWDKSDEDFQKHLAYFNTKAPNVGEFREQIEMELLESINSSFSKEFQSIIDAINYIRTLKSDELTDNYEYDVPKISIIPAGTIFYRRQKTEIFESINKEIWLDYTGTMSVSQFSFLKDYNEKYTKEQYDETKKYFGEYLMKFKVKQDLLILHFPSYVSSYAESWVRYMCSYSRAYACVDGYTLDFLKFNPNEIYSKFKSLDGFRELCVLNATNIELIE